MTKVVASTPEIERLLRRLDETVVAGGGALHGDVTFSEHDGDFSVRAPSSIAPRQIIISTPAALLLPVSRFGLHLVGDDIAIGALDPLVTPYQAALMEIVLDLFNATEKIARHCERSIYPLFRDDLDLFSRIAFPEQVQARKNRQGDNGLLSDFLNARVLKVGSDVPGGRPLSVLMPAIDFLNHNSRAPGYVMHRGSLVATRGYPAQAGDECFICYGRYDAQDLLLTYDFVPGDMDFAISKPLDFEIEDLGRVTIRRGGGPMNASQIPDHMRDLGWILPGARTDQQDRSIEFDYLPVPSEREPGMLRRILEYFVGQVLVHRQSNAIAARVDEIEARVIDENTRHYETLKNELVVHVPKPGTENAIRQIKRMIEIQLEIFTNYSFDAART